MFSSGLGETLVLCGALCVAGCYRTIPADTPSTESLTYQQAQYICGKVSGTRQETNVATRGQRRVSTVALLTSSTGVAGTLATALVGIADDSEEQRPTLVTGVISAAVTAAMAAVTTYLTDSDDTKARQTSIAEIKVEAKTAMAELDAACATDPNNPKCSYAAARVKGLCEAQANSLPFEP